MMDDEEQSVPLRNTRNPVRVLVGCRVCLPSINTLHTPCDSTVCQDVPHNITGTAQKLVIGLHMRTPPDT
jgi:hypothetical protein